MKYRNVRAFVWIATLLTGALPAAAQLSNASLQGTYNFRYNGVTATPCDCPVSFIGAITFDGKGGFTVTGQGNYVNTTGGAAQTLTRTASGSYPVFSGGMYYMDNPFAANGIGSAVSGTQLYGGVGQG